MAAVIVHDFVVGRLLPLFFDDLVGRTFLCFRVQQSQSLTAENAEPWRAFLATKYTSLQSFSDAFSEHRGVLVLPSSVRSLGVGTIGYRACVQHFYEWYLLIHSPYIEPRWIDGVGIGLFAKKNLDVTIMANELRLYGQRSIPTKKDDARFSSADCEVGRKKYLLLISGPLSLVNHACAQHYNTVPYDRGTTERIREMQNAHWRIATVIDKVRRGEQLLIQYSTKTLAYGCFICQK